MNAALVLRHHIVTAGETDELFKRLVQSCHYHLDVFPLSSGRSGSVSGQVVIFSCVPADSCAEPGMVLKVALHWDQQQRSRDTRSFHGAELYSID